MTGFIGIIENARTALVVDLTRETGETTLRRWRAVRAQVV